MDIDDVHRLAQGAHDIATKAQHDADMAGIAGTTHEQICAERYQVINEKLGDMKRGMSLAASDQKSTNTNIFASLNKLQSKFDKMSGVDLAFRYTCLFLGACGTVFGIVKAIH